jgi:hypothetical protein
MLSRLKQVWYYVTPEDEGASRDYAAGILNPAQLDLFSAMSRPDQAHAVRVASRLAAQQAPTYVLEAALLHDCGKPRGYNLFWRSAGVLLDGAIRHLPKEPPVTGPQRWLQVYKWHDAYGLDLARAAGTSPEAMALLEAYMAPERQEAPAWLGPLQVSDDAG